MSANLKVAFSSKLPGITAAHFPPFSGHFWHRPSSSLCSEWRTFDLRNDVKGGRLKCFGAGVMEPSCYM